MINVVTLFWTDNCNTQYNKGTLNTVKQGNHFLDCQDRHSVQSWGPLFTIRPGTILNSCQDFPALWVQVLPDITKKKKKVKPLPSFIYFSMSVNKAAGDIHKQKKSQEKMHEGNFWPVVSSQELH